MPDHVGASLADARSTARYEPLSHLADQADMWRVTCFSIQNISEDQRFKTAGGNARGKATCLGIVINAVKRRCGGDALIGSKLAPKRSFRSHCFLFTANLPAPSFPKSGNCMDPAEYANLDAVEQ